MASCYVFNRYVLSKENIHPPGAYFAFLLCQIRMGFFFFFKWLSTEIKLNKLFRCSQIGTSPQMSFISVLFLLSQQRANNFGLSYVLICFKCISLMWLNIHKTIKCYHHLCFRSYKHLFHHQHIFFFLKLDKKKKNSPIKKKYSLKK